MKFLIDRSRDVITGKTDLEELHKFKRFPVFMGCTENPEKEDLLVDMTFWISKSSGMIQLNPVLPLEIVYQESHGSGFVGNSWASHHQKFAEFIAKYSPKSVLEIGGGHGILAKNTKKLCCLDWTILEPNPSILQKGDIKIIKGFFNTNFKIDKEIDTIIHSHLFEHVYQPCNFVRDISNFLKEGQNLIFSVPNMEKMLKGKYTNCFNFEHTIYLNKSYINYLLNNNEFELVSEQNFLDDHSIFYCFRKSKNQINAKLSENLYETNKKLYLSYIKFHLKWAENINDKISKKFKDQVFLFGAHAQSQYMINFGIKSKYINSILDNNITKQGKRLYGTNLKVNSPNFIAKVKNPVVVLRAGTFESEIKKQLLEINSDVEILT